VIPEMIIIRPGLTLSSSRTRNLPTPVWEGMACPARSLLPADSSVLKSPENPIRSYGCGKGLSIAAPCYEMPGISGFLVSVPRVNPGGPLGSHLGFNRGSFSGDFPIGGKVAQALGGGRRG
jgi:hypothetical protein